MTKPPPVPAPTVSGRAARVLLGSSMLVMGACGLIYEYVLSVLGNYLIGSSHQEIFVVMGLMMFAMGVGSYLQSNVEGDLVGWFLRLEIVLGLVGGTAALAVYVIFSFSEAYRLALYGFALVVGALIGMEVPILIRINRAYSGSLRINLSEILSMDYVGSLVGALLFAYVLLAHVDLARIGFLLGVANVAIALVGLFAFWSLVARPRLHLLGALLALAALGLGFWRAPVWTAWAEQAYFADPIVHRETSKYQRVVLTQRGDRTNLYLNGHLQLSSADEHIYHDMLVHPAMTLAPQRARVLILGGGDGMALREVLKYPDVGQVTLVDLDPAVVRLASTHPELVRLNEGAFDDARVTTEAVPAEPGEEVRVTVHGEHIRQQLDPSLHEVGEVHVALYDADAFLQEAGGRYDVVILDFPDPGRLEVAKLFSRDFYALLRDHLRPGALVSLQSTSPVHAKRVYLCIGETLRAAGFSAVPYHQNVPSFGEWGFYLARAGRGGEDLLRRRMRSAEAIPVETRFITPGVLAAATEFGRGWLETERPVEPSSKMNPVIVEYYEDAWTNY